MLGVDGGGDVGVGNDVDDGGVIGAGFGAGIGVGVGVDVV